jgi:hypothetical protein
MVRPLRAVATVVVKSSTSVSPLLVNFDVVPPLVYSTVKLSRGVPG